MAPYIKRSAIWPDPRVKPPFGSVEIDWSHPLAMHLVSCFLFNEGGGRPIDLATGLAATLSGTPQGYAVAAGGSYIKTANIAYVTPVDDAARFGITSESFSLACDFYPSSADAGFAYFASRLDAGASDGWVVRTIAGKIFISTFAGGAQSSSNSVAGMTNDRLNRTVTVRTGSTPAYFVDGQSIATESNPGLDDAGASTGVYRIAANQSGGSIPKTGIDRALFYFGRSLSQEDAAWLNAEPYDFLRPIIRRRYFEPPPPPPSLVFQAVSLTAVNSGYL